MSLKTLTQFLRVKWVKVFSWSYDKAIASSFSRGHKKSPASVDPLSEQLPPPDGDEEHLKQWWDTNGQVWTNQLRAMMIEHRNIGHDWQFSIEQKKVLKQYYDANKLLVECLNSDCYVSREVRQEIEYTLLLPIAEIENYQQRIL